MGGEAVSGAAIALRILRKKHDRLLMQVQNLKNGTACVQCFDREGNFTCKACGITVHEVIG